MSKINLSGMTFKKLGSSSAVRRRRLRSFTRRYNNVLIKNLDKIVKAISFIVSIGVLLLFIGVAAVLLILDKTFIGFAVLVLLFGIVVALITLFLIYATGHIITQNNAILEEAKRE